MHLDLITKIYSQKYNFFLQQDVNDPIKPEKRTHWVEINRHLLKMSLHNNYKLINSFPKQNILLNREFYKPSNDIYGVMIGKVFLKEF